MKILFTEELAALDISVAGAIATLAKCATIAYIAGVDHGVCVVLICAYSVVKLFTILSKI